jgi:NAD(P)-dependent dehydrogenase (short-subunit alcohol dehydrogenase family)
VTVSLRRMGNSPSIDYPSRPGSVAIITGCNTGLGKENLKALLKKEWTVIVAVRSVTKGADAVAEIRAGGVNEGVAFVEELDLNDLSNVKLFCDRFREAHKHLDLLVMNAGIMGLPERQETKDEFEAQIGTNHFGHFFLFSCLQDLLQDGILNFVCFVLLLLYLLNIWFNYCSTIYYSLHKLYSD